MISQNNTDPSPNFKRNRQRLSNKAKRTKQKPSKTNQKEFTIPAKKSPTLEPLETSENEENVQIKAIDSEFSEMISSFLNQENTHPQKKFTKRDFNHYKINDKPFEVYYDRIEIDDKEFEVSPDFLKLFLKGNKVDFAEFNTEDMNAFINFVHYAGGLERDTRSNL